MFKFIITQISISISKEQIKQILLVIVLTFCLALAIVVISWANEHEKRPLIQDIKLVDEIKIIDALEASNISYVTRLDSQMILVNDEEMDQARLALARIGIVIDYPDVRQMANASEACDVLEAKIYEYANAPNTPLTDKPYFIK
ncbi:hypothetical protein [Colwellia sp. 12G3]|uniref:hypothetical protein n=1 Tax=Colwellia sp. 12G3 TaxID=2058299 RepID=UPI000C347183|nr:hypothetical protein [Colwellia sp. 12G3]PKI15944.1 hypothetical protein CXF71_11630 [Colwellia sp. 12G3]